MQEPGRLTCAAFPHCDWAHVWRADSGCKSSCHSSHRRMVSEVRGGGTVVKKDRQYQLLWCVHFSHCSVWLPAGWSHLPVPCVCRGEPLASMTYWTWLYNQKRSKHSFFGFATSPPSLIRDVRCGAVVTDKTRNKGAGHLLTYNQLLTCA